MLEQEFRKWLMDRRWAGKPLAAKAIANRIRRLRRLERSLFELGFGTDLDEVMTADGAGHLADRLRGFIATSPSREGMPQSLAPRADDPSAQLKNILAALRLYARFSHERASPPSAQMSPLDELREVFLERCPDFENFQKEAGTYWEVERRYKDQILEKVRGVRAGAASSAQDRGKQLYQAMMPNQGPLLRWQTLDEIEKKHPDLSQDFFGVITELSEFEGPVEDAVLRAANGLQKLRDRGATILTSGQISAIAFTTAACVAPTSTVPFKATKAQELAKRLTGDRIFDGGLLQLGQVQKWQELLQSLHKSLVDWGWQPRDLFDVQGFAWVALDETWDADRDEEDEEADDLGAGPYWFVGSSFGRKLDQTERFIRDGIWEIDDPNEANANLVRAMTVGDRIAIKSTFIQKHGLPFDNHGRDVSVMRLKATGTIIDKTADGARVEVAWDAGFDPKDWYFYTYQPTIWRVNPGAPYPDALIRFAFFDQEQDIEFFLGEPHWASQYGRDSAGPRFWIEKTIVAGRPDRLEGDHSLGRALWSPQRSKDGKNIYAAMAEVQTGDVVFHLTDNSGISHVSVAAAPADDTFQGVDGTEWANQAGYRIELQDAQKLEPPLGREAFLGTEPYASELKELVDSGAKGLFYNRKLELNQGAYLTEATPTLLGILNRAYQEIAGRPLPYVGAEEEVQPAEPELEPYTLENALEDLFLDPALAADIMLLWRAKKNVILQGPPGVGKSFAAQRLAFALIGHKDRSRLGFVQFHQSYSYEDFVEGFRPTETGFKLQSGKFVEFCRRAEADPKRNYVFVIDEINRGNLSKIMGELMLLIEPDKRSADWAMPLASGKAPFHVPANVHLLGLMNTADRSLAVVDYALRRRFAFVDLAPNLASPKFREHLLACGIADGTISMLLDRVEALNAEIVGDVINLGPGFAIGHSFFCSGLGPGENDADWYGRIVRTEIAPLLREYWFDQPAKAQQWTELLLAAP